MKPNNKRKILACLIAFSVLAANFSNLSNIYAESNKKRAEEIIKFAASSAEKQVVESEAEKAGKKYGEMHASRDFAKNLIGSITRHFPDDKSVFEFFKMDYDSKNAKTQFYLKFKENYVDTYNKTFFELSMGKRDNNDPFWFTIAKKYGNTEGTMAANYDHYNERSSDWDRAFSEYVRNESLKERFRLHRYSGKIPGNFRTDFKTYFEIGYRNAYANAIVADNEANTNYHYVSAEPSTISYKRPHSASVQVDLEFRARSVFEITPMAIRFKQHKNKFIDEKLIPLTDIYQVEIQRNRDEVEFSRAPIMKINGFGVRGAGIYSFKNGKWRYEYTTIKDGKLEHRLPLGYYKSTNYTVFLDRTYVMPSDITFNWAYKEIYTAVRRHHLPAIRRMRPDHKITRTEMADIIYRVQKYRMPNPKMNASPSDISRLKHGQHAIKFAVANGFMKLKGGSSFKPNSYVSYSEFKEIMLKLGYSDFDIAKFSNKILRENYHRNDFITKKSQNISRAEVIFAITTYID